MSQRRTLVVIAVSLALMAGPGRRASAGSGGVFGHLTFMTPGSVCQPADGVTREWRYTARWGIHRACSSCSGSSTVVCPTQFAGFDFPMPQGSGQLKFVTATVYDRSSVADVSCTLMVTSEDGGTVLFSQTKSSADNTGPAQTLDFDIPSGRATISDQSLGQITMICDVPAATASGVSHVTNIRTVLSTAAVVTPP